jgi:carnitine-CoA ligase
MQVHATVIQFGMCNAQSHGYRSDDIVYICLPLNHANAYLNSLWGAFIADASVAVSRGFSVSRYWSEVRKSGATITNLLGSMVNMLWSRPASDDDKDHRLRTMSMVPVPKFAADWEQRHATRIVSSYGLTDFASVAIYTLTDPPSKLGSAGRPRPGFEFQIVDENDAQVPAGVTGEVVLRSLTPWAASLGYYKMPEATLSAMRNLWWHTGDYGHVDADGYLYFGDRKKDSLRRRGENISAFEVESIILQHPSIKDAAVFAISSEMSEDEVAAAIVLVDGHTLAEAELIVYCAKNMAHYMVPRFIQVCADLPRTSSHKVRKDVLRQAAQADRSLLWDREAHGVVVER